MRMEIILILLALLALLLVPAVQAQQCNTLLEVRLDPPVAGVVIAWQTRSFATDSAGIWKHTVTVSAGANYELVGDGSAAFVGVKGTSGMVVTWLSGTRVRFRFTSAPGAQSGPITIYVLPIEATPMPTVTTTPTIGPSPTVGPSATPTVGPTADPAWGPLPLDVMAAIEARGYEVEAMQCSGLLPPIDENAIRMAPGGLLWAMRTHTGLLAVWGQRRDADWGAASYWRVDPGRLHTGLYTVTAPNGLTYEALGAANCIGVRQGVRVWLVQYGGYIQAAIEPGMAREVGR